MIMINRRTFAKHAGLAAAAAIVPGISAAHTSGEPRRIGFLMPLTGDSGKLGQMMLEGAAVGVEEVNAAAGAGGRPVELVQEDSQALAQQGIAGFLKLVDVNKTNVIFTGWTAVVSAIAPLATESKVMLLSASTASPAVRGISPYFQSTWMFDDETVKLILPYAKDKLKVKSLAVLTVESDLGTALAQAVKADWTRIGGAIAAEDVHQPGETSFRPILLKMLGTKPDAIYLTSSNGKQLAQIVRQAREIGYKGIFLSYGAFEDPEVLTLGAQANGCYYSSPSYDAANPGAAGRKFVDAFQKKYGRLPNVHQADHYDLVLLYTAVADGLAKQNKPLTGASFREYLTATIPQYQGAAGNYRFNYKDGSVLRSSIVKVVRDGKFTKLDNLV
ncbi:MAG: amino acid ABC transporter substrate-binding protein [Pusillimonas sp.]|nr:MAG: amino acid ABC transporter substrate-binding protein [Pusillimonas sp.]